MSGDFLREMEIASRARVLKAKTSESAGELHARALRRSPLNFRQLLGARTGTRIIAETKRKSPSLGDIAPELDAVDLALGYAQAGAAAISVLTEPLRFGGSLEQLERVRAALPAMPLLMKDFLVDPYQLLQARAHGADAVLLIFSLLGPAGISRLLARAGELGLTALVEVHDEGELREAMSLGATFIGMNNRDLRTLRTNLEVSKHLAPLKQEGVLLVSESGIGQRSEVEELERLGVDAFLVGTHLVRNPGLIRTLKGEAV